MKAIILAAGFGTRLKPWTDEHPKALVPVEGKPMLQRVIETLVAQGILEICVNIHHKGEQIIDFLENNHFDCRIIISDERDSLLDTGGGVVKAYSLLGGEDPVIVHNVDILSNADLRKIYSVNLERGEASTLLVSERDSSRKLLFDNDWRLKGWHNLKENKFLPKESVGEKGYREFAFSGIYVAGKKMIDEMQRLKGVGKYPVMEYFLDPLRRQTVRGYNQGNLCLLDIGKPASLAQASDILRKLSCDV